MLLGVMPTEVDVTDICVDFTTSMNENQMARPFSRSMETLMRSFSASSLKQRRRVLGYRPLLKALDIRTLVLIIYSIGTLLGFFVSHIEVYSTMPTYCTTWETVIMVS